MYNWSPQGRKDGCGDVKGKKKIILYVHISSGHLKTRANIFSNLMKIINPQV